MRSGLSAVAAKSNITAQWVFECDSNYWTFGNNITYGGNAYVSKIITDSFTGIQEKNTRYADGLIPPNTTEFSITGAKTDFSPPDFIGEDVLITLLDSGVKVYSWRFSVKSCHYEYGRFNFTCEDFLQKYLFNKYYPTTDLLNSYNTTTAVMEGPDNAVIPQVFGTAYPQLRMIPSDGEWYPVLGPVTGTYTISKIQSPVEYTNQTSEYSSPTYTFTQSTVSGVRVFSNNIGTGGTNAIFGQSGKLYDIPVNFSNSTTVTVTNLADIISLVLQSLGVPPAQIDTAGTFATAKADITTVGIDFDYCFTTKEDAQKVLCELLESCNCILPRSDVVQLIMLEDGAAVKTITRDHILNLTFSEKKYNDDFDAGYATYWTGVQAGKPSEIAIPINGTSYTNISAEKVHYKYTNDTQIIQKLAIINYRRKFLKTGTVSFSSNHSMIEPYLGDRISISDDLYETYANVYIDQITIKPDLKFEFSLDAYSETIGDLTDYSPTVVTKTDYEIADDAVPSLTAADILGAGQVFTNECNDTPSGKENDLWIPSAISSPLSAFMAVTHRFSPYVTIYNTSDFSKVTNPSVLPGAYGRDVTFNHDGSLLVVAYDGGDVYIYDTSDWSRVTGPATPIGSLTKGVAFNHDSSLLAIAHTGGNYLTICDTSDWSKITGPSTKPTGNGLSVAFNNDGSRLVVGHSIAPFVTVYDTSDWSVDTTLADGESANYDGNGVAFSRDGTLLSVARAKSPYVTIYNTSDWSKITNPSSLPSSLGLDVEFNHDGSLLAVASFTTPYVFIYNTSDWSKVSNPSTLPTGGARGVSFNSDGSLLTVAHVTTPYVTIYNTSDWSKVSDPSSLPAGDATRVDFSNGLSCSQYLEGELYISLSGVWTIATIYDETTVASIAAAMVSAPLVVTNQIRDAASNLVIDFDDATITVETANGLIINSGAGISVNGDININSGGDLNVAKDGSATFVGGCSVELYSNTIATGESSSLDFYHGIKGSSPDLVTSFNAESATELSITGPGVTGCKLSLSSFDYINLSGVLINQSLDTSAPADAEVSNDHCIFYYVSGNLWAKWKEGSTVYNKQVT